MIRFVWFDGSVADSHNLSLFIILLTFCTGLKRLCVFVVLKRAVNKLF